MKNKAAPEKNANNPPAKHRLFLLEYNQQIQSGKIKACNDIKMLYRQLAQDLKNPWFRYDPKFAHLRIEFMENFCRQTKSPYNGKPLKLLLWEKAFIECIYSFYWTKEGYLGYYGQRLRGKHRRFKNVLLLVARKNGKSTLTAADGITDLMIGEPGADLICSSNSHEQAAIIFDEIKNMAAKMDPGEIYLHSNLAAVANKRHGSKCAKMSEKTKNKEGKNIDKAYLDESNELKDRGIVDPIMQSMSSKENPLFINITTEGFVINGFLDKEIQKAERIIKGEITDPTSIGFLYRMDTEEELWQNPASWIKANPSLDHLKSRVYLIDALNDAKISLEKRAFVLCKDFNIKTSNATAWLMREDVENDLIFEPDEIRGSICIGGFDYAETTDLAAVKFMCIKKMIPGPGMKPIIDPRRYIIQKYFIPEIRLTMGTEEEQKRFKDWAKAGMIEICQGGENNLEQITQYIIETIRNNSLRLVQFSIDGWHLKQWGKTHKDELRIAEIPMRHEVLSSPMSQIEIDLRAKNINYNGHPIDAWCLLNTGVEFDKRGKMRPIKINEDRTRKIDGALALILCYAGYQTNKEEIEKYL